MQRPISSAREEGDASEAAPRPLSREREPLWWRSEHAALSQRSAWYRLGRVLALLYEEGVLEALGINTLDQACELTLEDPKLVLLEALGERRQRPQKTYLADIDEAVALPSQPPAAEEHRQFILGYQREIALLVLTRWWFWPPPTLETV